MIAVYALSCIDCPNDIYVGSSKNIKQRMRNHKTNCNNVDGRKYNRKVYTFIRSHGNWEKWRYHIIEEFDVYDKKLLEEREDYWIMELKSSLNSIRAHLTEEDNKEVIKKYNKKYREVNKAKKTAPNFCECGGEYQFKNKAQHFKTKRCLNYMASIISPSAPPSL